MEAGARLSEGLLPPLEAALDSLSKPLSMLSLLLERGANPNYVNGKGIGGALRTAAMKGCEDGDVISLLLSHGADVNQITPTEDEDGKEKRRAEEEK